MVGLKRVMTVITTNLVKGDHHGLVDSLSSLTRGPFASCFYSLLKST